MTRELWGDGHIAQAGNSRGVATNSEQDIDLQRKEGMLNRMTCSVGELEVWDGVVSIVVLIYRLLDGSLENGGGR